MAIENSGRKDCTHTVSTLQLNGIYKLDRSCRLSLVVVILISGALAIIRNSQRAMSSSKTLNCKSGNTVSI